MMVDCAHVFDFMWNYNIIAECNGVVRLYMQCAYSQCYVEAELQGF